MKKKNALLIPIIALLLTGCDFNPLNSVRNFWNRIFKKDEQGQKDEQADITPEKKKEEEPEVKPEPKEDEDDVVPGPFTFDQFQYKLKDGVNRSEIQGNPWINSNIKGQLEKIEKPSLKNDFYASVNYDAILNNQDGIFDKASKSVDKAFEKMFSITNGTEDAELLAIAKSAMVEGNCEEISTFFANFDYSSYVSSSAFLESGDSYFTISKSEENKYYIKFNDGYYCGDINYGFFAYLGYYATTARANVVAELNSAFNLGLKSTQIDSIDSMEAQVTDDGINDYAYGGGEAYSVFSFGETSTSLLDGSLTSIGLTNSDDIYINQPALSALSRIKSYSAEVKENALKLRLAFGMRYLTGLEHYKVISRNLSTIYYFSEKDVSDDSDDAATKSMIKHCFSDVVERDYLEAEGDALRKNKVTEMIGQIIDQYKTTASTYEWLDSTTRNGVIRKLTKMRFESCYSEKRKAYPSIDDTGLYSLSLLGIYQRYQKWQLNLKLNDLYETNPLWNSMPSYTVNAFYSPTDNAFVILNGVVGGISTTDDYEKLLGSIGVVIGHEISHSIDSQGAQFDEDGNYTNWWSATSLKRFNAKVQALSDFYKQIGVSNSLNVNGDKVDGEATADMGGMHIALEIAKTIEGFNYDLFFRTYADLWKESPISESKVAERNQDEHPFEYLRVNTVVSQFDEFFETYGIKSGHKMYIPEDQRVAIW